MSPIYQAPEATKVGHIHLKVSDILRSLSFYRDLLGFQVTAWYGDQAVFLSAGGYHHHIGLNTWHSEGQAPSPRNRAGMYHVAFLYPGRKELAHILKRLIDTKYPLIGASDHGVSEAIYLEDPDQNGVELYCDRPRDQWVITDDGSIEMVNKALDLEGLLSILDH